MMITNSRIARNMTVAVLLLLIGGRMQNHAQQFEWKADFFGFFDNREYFNDYTVDQTIFGENGSAEAGFAINHHNRFRAGLSFIYENGTRADYTLPRVILYYKGEWKPVTFYIGSFPRYQLIDQPLAMLTDTLIYFRPVVEGMLLEYRRDWGFQHIWLDWTGRQTDTIPEAFLLGASGLIHKGMFIYRHHLLMYHHALPANNKPDDHIRDNGGMNAMVGLTLSDRLPLDTMTVSSGVLMSYDRWRSIYDLHFMWGWISDINVSYKGFGLHGVYYRGDGQVLLYGDGFYKSGNYGRADFYFQRTWLDKITGKMEFSLHFLPGNVDFSYTICLRASMDGRIQLGKSERSLRF
ncbi:MAG: hypothetical protein JW973_12440 [Bacteroidales bacterium]|nr:hypothetical protein [Bacteroidales bacterium]